MAQRGNHIQSLQKIIVRAYLFKWCNVPMMGSYIKFESLGLHMGAHINIFDYLKQSSLQPVSILFTVMFLQPLSSQEMWLPILVEGWMAAPSINPGRLHKWHIMFHQLMDSMKWWWLPVSNSCINNNNNSIHTTTMDMTITVTIIEHLTKNSVFKYNIEL